jgi:hypothetical protein
MTVGIRGLAVWGACTAAVIIASAVVAGQAGPAPRTSWGAPDLQGIWSNPAVVPFERAKQFGTREFLTDEEHAKAIADLLERNKDPGRDSRVVRGKDARGTEQDVARAYNEFWFGDKPTQVGRRTSMVIDPPDGRIPPLTAQAQKRMAEEQEYLDALLQGSAGGKPGPLSPRRKERPPFYNLERLNRADGPEDRSGPERCFGSTLPVFLQAGGLSGFARIVQSPDAVTLYYDVGQGSGFSRVIPITDRPHLPAEIRLYHGDARGRWEDDTLVVDITNFSQRTNVRGAGKNLHLIERFRRVDANTLSYQVTYEDPTTWARPFTALQEWTKNDEATTPVLEGGCHEGNYGLLGMLANTRAAEKLFRAGKGPDPDKQWLASGGTAVGQ